MHKEFLMGNAAIALGAVASGVNVVAGYPGTPSTEVLETIAKHRPDDVYVEWSVNEKAAMELAAGASYSGARTLVTMKQVGLNVASDPLMSLEYIGVKGGMVILVADDPGPISSQTEQDTRHFAAFSKLPCFDPSSAQEAYEMIQEAYEYSEKYNTPVFLRPTTRVCHGYASVSVKDPEEYTVHTPEGFVKDSKRWVIFPRLSYQNHQKIEARNVELADIFSSYEKNKIYPACDTFADSRKGIVSGGISFTYAMETLIETGMVRHLKISTPHPFPEKLAAQFLDGLDEVLCLEELDPVIERELTYICGKYHLPVKILGKLTHNTANAGENTRDSVDTYIRTFLDLPVKEQPKLTDVPPLPVRPPVLCAGCPHRASFYAVKKAMQGRKTIFCGDIGCYTLGNASPLDMVDTCLCMGAGLNIAQGVEKIEPDTACFAFVGDSTFFASAITGVVNAVYNQANMTLVVLDNSTTAMTGHQPHPGTGRTVMGEIVQKINIEQVLRGIGVQDVETVNPLDHEAAVSCVKELADKPGVKAIIFKSPCIAVTKPGTPMHVDISSCIHCKKCIRELGCPAIITEDGNVSIDSSMCTGCGLCSQICPVHAIKGGKQHD
ncbi:indolepyruvate ferredoxin oxidoreductase subunit alpha [Dorea sp. AF24-7LB]|uniref:indolepyruvate ferredoxin oxidoreductase subunit alpha n=1 Tax=Dorea sp. AF24-7LB TaxID=2293097 RepID=UPI000E4945DB|nr:indolepyruvate ferredoxin oxidoreductase subunit alpha [Dorea sp. AF24-7LB]RHQ53669.1 indolepyruvate ferredoxin oxidoreductase subunit alpha [Dorea sp. AF24-7LB]